MSSIKVWRAEVRRLTEIRNAARMLGEHAEVISIEKDLEDAKKCLAVKLLEERKHGVSKADESEAKPKVVPARDGRAR